MRDPTRTINSAYVEQLINFNDVIILEDNIPKLIHYVEPTGSIDDFDNKSQDNWYMPNEYKTFDIAKFVLDCCKTDEELQRVGEELIKFQERNMFPLLCYCKYLVDTMRKHNIVWGVGRGSSVASYVLFLIGIHRINSLHYDISIDEFLK
jgi:DNA polymerase III alpha subunit